MYGASFIKTASRHETIGSEESRYVKAALILYFAEVELLSTYTPIYVMMLIKYERDLFMSALPRTLDIIKRDLTKVSARDTRFFDKLRDLALLPNGSAMIPFHVQTLVCCWYYKQVRLEKIPLSKVVGYDFIGYFMKLIYSNDRVFSLGHFS